MAVLGVEDLESSKSIILVDDVVLMIGRKLQCSNQYGDTFRSRQELVRVLNMVLVDLTLKTGGSVVVIVVVTTGDTSWGCCVGALRKN